ncbi:hypothetical protein BDF22DRAFT_778804 [Syncephalis plumigaleata]|nr:hypothetical protein BDF22DRAFT_778804 [Syncephalis plumigaleata]
MVSLNSLSFAAAMMLVIIGNVNALPVVESTPGPNDASAPPAAGPNVPPSGNANPGPIGSTSPEAEKKEKADSTTNPTTDDASSKAEKTEPTIPPTPVVKGGGPVRPQGIVKVPDHVISGGLLSKPLRPVEGSATMDDSKTVPNLEDDIFFGISKESSPQIATQVEPTISKDSKVDTGRVTIPAESKVPRDSKVDTGRVTTQVEPTGPLSPKLT